MAERCKGTKKNGEACGAMARTNGFCPMHANPALAASLGRRSGQVRRHVNRDDDRPELAEPKSAADLKHALSGVFSDVRNRKLDPAVGRTLAQVAAAIFRAIELADLEERLARLESTQGNITGGERR